MGERSTSAVGPGSAGKPRKVVVCCVGGDAVSLMPAIDLLGARGLEIAVVEGQDVRLPALAEQPQRHGADAIWVLALLREAPLSAVAPLEAALRSNGVPGEHVISLAIDWREPMALVERIDAFERMLADPSASPAAGSAPIVRASAPSPSAGRRDSTGPQRAISLVSPRAETGSHRTVPPPPRTGTGPQPTVAATQRKDTGPQRAVAPAQREATGPQRTVDAPSPVAAPPPQEVAASPRPVTPAKIEPSVRRRMLAVEVPLPPPDASTSAPDLPRVLPQTEPSFPAPQSIFPLSCDRMPVAAHPPAAVAPPAEPEPPVEPELDLPPRANPLRTVTAALRPMAAKTGSSIRALAGSRGRMLALAGVVTLSFVGIVWLATRTPGTSTSDEPRPTTVAEPSTAAKREPTPSEGSAPGGSDRADATAAIAQARARGDLGVYEGIVFAPKHAPKRSFRGAQKLCDEMNQGAIKGWRMPTLAELHVLALGQVIDRGVYWSGTEAEAFGDRALIWSEKKTTAAPITKVWSGARALCVRGEPAPRESDSAP